MKAPLAFSFVTVVLLAGVVFFEETRIADLRRQIAVHQANAAELTGKVSRLGSELEDLQRRLKDSKVVAEQLQSALSKGGAATPGADPAQVPAAGSKETSGAKWMQGIAKMFTDPEMRKSMRTQQMFGIRMMYGDLMKELGLSSQESEQLMELLTDRQMDMAAAGMKAFDANNPNQAADSAKIADETKRYEDQIKSVLGEEKYAKLKTYEGSMGDRFMLQQFEGQFGAAGAPLETNQKEQLLTLMRDERANTPSQLNLSNSSNPAQQMEVLKNPDMVNQFVSSQQEFQKRVLERSRQFLNADQVSALEKVQQQQLDFIKMQMKMSKEMLGLDK